MGEKHDANFRRIWRMKPIDGDRLKELLDDTEDILKSISKIELANFEQESWDTYVSEVGVVFRIVRDVIDRMPRLDHMER